MRKLQAFSKMKSIIILFLSLVIFADTAAIEIAERSTTCNLVSIPEEELKQMLESSHLMSQFVEENLQSDEDSLRKALSDLKEILQNITIVLSNVEKPSQELLTKEISGVHKKSSSLQTNSVLSRKSMMEALIKDEFRFLLNDEAQIAGEKNKRIKRTFQEHFPLTTDSIPRPIDCADLLITGETKSGVYTIYPFRCFCSLPIKVYCDMETEGGGWTVFLNRQKQEVQEDFNKTWENYRNGFGNASKEYWIGNEALHLMTNSRNYTMRFDAKSRIEGWKVWGEYAIFKIDSEEFKYKLTIGGYDSKSIMHERFIYHNNMFFSTIDRDNDKNSKNCASTQGPFWNNNCGYHRLTTPYEELRLKPWSKTIQTDKYLSGVQMKIRPSVCKNRISAAALNSHNCYGGH